MSARVARVATHSSHWGAYSVRVVDGEVVDVVPHPDDPAPSALLGNVAASLRHPTRIRRPAVRRGWWEQGPGPDGRRGCDDLIEVGWSEVLDRLASELHRVYTAHGASAVFGGSYGWASAGRFHHAQSQLHRFLNLLGGYTRSVNTYSLGASAVILPHVVGDFDEVLRHGTSWEVIAAHTDLIVSFGGIPTKNVSVNPGGFTRHRQGEQLRAAAARGTRLVLFSPLRDDAPEGLATMWLPLRPGTDTAVMLALCHVLVTDGLADHAFLARCTTGAERFLAYVRGETDGTPKTPAWAESISGVPGSELRALAHRMAAGRTLVTVSWSLQRARFGEQPVWAGIALAALLGQIGLPGGGFGHGYGSMADVGESTRMIPLPTLAQGSNPVRSFIPVARIADLLLCPGETFAYNGKTHTYPDTRLVYWAGGNPFHHHQDLNRLRRAFQQPDTVVVHEPFWTPTARHADVVLPVTTTLERNDIGAGRKDRHLHAMRQAVRPVGEARNDADVFAELARRLGTGSAFTEGRDEWGWLHHLWEQWRERLLQRDVEAPPFDEFWAAGQFVLPADDPEVVLFADFRRDPKTHPLRTPSGRIELWSETIAGFGYDDCPPHPVWLEPEEWLGGPRAARFPLHLVANQPATRLHSQLDVGATSVASKVAGREPIRIHPDDAAARGVREGDVVEVWNDRGSLLAGAVLSESVRPGVVQLATGAWFDPEGTETDRVRCVHGNPNAVTADIGTSRLAQGSTGQHALVDLHRFDGPPPPVRAHQPPAPLQP